QPQRGRPERAPCAGLQRQWRALSAQDGRSRGGRVQGVRVQVGRWGNGSSDERDSRRQEPIEPQRRGGRPEGRQGNSPPAWWEEGWTRSGRGGERGEELAFDTHYRLCVCPDERLRPSLCPDFLHWQVPNQAGSHRRAVSAGRADRHTDASAGAENE